MGLARTPSRSHGKRRCRTNGAGRSAPGGLARFTNSVRVLRPAVSCRPSAGISRTAGSEIDRAMLNCGGAGFGSKNCSNTHQTGGNTVQVSHEPWLVVLSVLVAIQGAYVGLSLAVRISSAGVQHRRALLAGLRFPGLSRSGPCISSECWPRGCRFRSIISSFRRFCLFLPAFSSSE